LVGKVNQMLETRKQNRETMNTISLDAETNDKLKKAKLENGFYNIINGEKVSAGKALSVVNPSTGKRLASVPDIDRALLDQAVNAAQKAFSGWREVLLSQRKVILTSLLNRIDGHAEELSALLTAEQGDALAGAWAQSRRIAFPRCPIRG
jgi:delta 1-pyrroline-5-carboxylate dehydrogenase